jgi:hypothetical protein
MVSSGCMGLSFGMMVITDAIKRAHHTPARFLRNGHKWTA